MTQRPDRVFGGDLLRLSTVGGKTATEHHDVGGFSESAFRVAVQRPLRQSIGFHRVTPAHAMRSGTVPEPATDMAG